MDPAPDQGGRTPLRPPRRPCGRGASRPALRTANGRCYQTVTNADNPVLVRVVGHPDTPNGQTCWTFQHSCALLVPVGGRATESAGPSAPREGGGGTTRNFTTPQQTCKTPAVWLALAHRFGALLADTLGHRPPSASLGNASTAQRSRPSPKPQWQHRKRPLSGQRDTHSAEWR
jgi:hypothetical protein